MAFADAMHAYFRGEKLEAFGFILPIGVVLLAFAAVAVKVERPGFAWGVAIPCILFGLVVIGTGWVVGSRTAGQVAELDRIFAGGPVELLTVELPRMRDVNEAFALYVKGYLAMAVIGLGLRFALSADFAHGLGSALILIAGLGFMIDGFAERRARVYTQALSELSRDNPIVD
jgi:putative Mn2+ efflux pump MntP